MTTDSIPLPASPLKGEEKTATPSSPVATRLLARARREWEARQFEDAERSLGNVLALLPGDPRAIRMLGMVARGRGDYARAVDCFREVMPVWSDDVFLRTELGLSLLSLDETDEALVHFRRACEIDPDSVSTWFNLGQALWRQAQGDDAVAAFQRALALEPAHIEARLALARAQAGIGRVENAVTEFREVLRRDPANADAWYGLSLNAPAFDAADTECLQRVFARADLCDRAHYLPGFALAKALEDRGDRAGAFEVLQQANASQHAGMHAKWNAARKHAFVDAVLDAFTHVVPSVTDADLTDAYIGRPAIFVTGMPRSGSTLVEQILASHPDVAGANEIRDMPHVINAETQRRGSAFPLWVSDATGDDWRRLGQEYLARTARWRVTKSRFTDKNLTSWHFTGAALAMLPAAPVIIVRRDPVETCLACYRHCFTEEAGFACDLDDVADYCVDFLRLTRFWIEKYPTRVFDLQYEALVADPERIIRRLLDFCGLPFNPTCLEPHKTSRIVLTPSAAQVRQPLHRDSARSARYGDKLDRLRERLRKAGVQVE